MRPGPVLLSLFKAGRGLVLGTASLTCLFIVLVWIVTVSVVLEEQNKALDGWAAESESIASIISANLDELLGRGVLYAELKRPLLEPESPSASSAIVHQQLPGDSAYLRHAVFRADGSLLRAGSAAKADPALLALARQLLTADTTGRDMGAALIGAPLPAAQGGYWGIPLAVPVYGSDNRLLGVFAAYIDLGYLLNLYKEVSLRTGSTISFRHADGRPLAELRDGMLADAGASRPPMTRPGTGAIRIAPALGERGPVGVYRRLDRYPVTLTVTRDSAAVLATLDTRHSYYYLRAGLASLGLLVLGLGLIALARRQQMLYVELSRSELRNKELIEQLESEKTRAVELASHDFLTRLPNRMMFQQLAAAEIARARRSRRLYALYFLDLDKFKTINDTLGHGVGDLLLQAVAARLRTTLREYDLIARIGGDEFVILVSELESTRRAAAIAQKLVDALSAPYGDLDGHLVETSPSIGIALYPGDGLDVDAMMAAADQAMYQAKRSGRGTYRFYDGAINTAAARKLELATQLRQAVRNKEFRLHYQMRIRLDDFRPVGLEALMRWEHPGHGMISPGEFIPLAEEHDVIQALGSWAIDAACAQLAAWREAGVPLVPVAINISARQLLDDGLLDCVSAALARHEIHPALLEVEVTESCLMERPDVARQVLLGLHQAGIRISLDDYGTGFSGLSHLKQLPVWAVKIDRSFIRDIRNDTSDAMIVASTISLSHSLNLKVVAEGVETREQVVHLKAAGCDEVQGYYFHHPADADSVGHALRERLLMPEQDRMQ